MSRTISQILNDYTSSWENIEFVDPMTGETATVQPPYVMDVPNYIKKEHRENNSHWEGKDKTGYFYTLDRLQTEIPELDGVVPSGSSRGKCRPEVIKAFLEEEGRNLTSEMSDRTFNSYRDALIYYGIGVDCSGFVSRAIARVMNELNIDPELRKKTLGLAGNAYKSNTTTLCCFRKDTNDLSSHTGLKLVAPTDVLPGDVLFKKDGGSFHILIVTALLPCQGSARCFQTAEASAVKDKLRVLRKTWKYDSSEDKLEWAYDESPETWTKVSEWNSSYRKSKYHFGRPLAFVDVAIPQCC